MTYRIGSEHTAFSMAVFVELELALAVATLAVHACLAYLPVSRFLRLHGLFHAADGFGRSVRSRRHDLVMIALA